MASLLETFIRNLCLPAFLIVSATAYALGPQLVSPENGATQQPSDPTLSWTVGPTTNLVVGGGFETGGGWLTSGLNLQSFTRVNSTNSAEGRYYGQIRASAQRPFYEIFIFQTVTIPRAAVTARLSWKDFSLGSSPETSGTYRVLATATGAQQSQLVLHESPVGLNDSDDFWIAHESDLTSFVGREVILEFNLTNRTSTLMGLRLDDVRLELTPTSPYYELYVGPTPNLGAAQRVSRLTDTFYTVIGLAPGSTNYWRVLQVGGGAQISSPVYSFVVDGSFVGPLVAPLLSAPAILEGQFQASFTTQAGHTYRIERTLSLNPAQWQAAAGPIDGTGEVMTLPVPLPEGDSGYYRVIAE